MQLTARRLITPATTIDHPLVEIEDGCISSITARDISNETDIIAPTFLDIHIHGAANHDVMEGTLEAFNTIGRFLATRGVSHYLPTTVTTTIDRTLRALEGIADSIESEITPGAASPIGIHLEGPFISHIKRGVHPPEDLQPPSIELFNRFHEAARGHIRLITIAPELPGALDLIAHAKSIGIRISLGHTNATKAEAEAAIAAGATSATHTFNAMRALDHREPGILGVTLDNDQIYAELICDGIHVAPELVRLWLRSKGAHRSILVTDGISATGMPDGTYTLGPMQVEVANNRCLHNGTLAGSILTMDRAIANLMQFTGCPLEIAIQAATTNPAAMLGLPSFEPIIGSPANFNLYTAEGQLKSTILNGISISH